MRSSRVRFSHWLMGAILCLTTGCGQSPTRDNAREQSASASAAAPAPPVGYTPEVILLADPQLHQVEGGSLKRQTWLADWIEGVAIRPPKLNLLAPLVLRHLIEVAVGKGRPSPPPIDTAIALGDLSNVACSGELRRFSQVMHDAGFDGESRVWLAAHGNHDSFLMGISQKEERLPDGRPDTVRLYPPENARCATSPPCTRAGQADCCDAAGYSGWSSTEASDLASEEDGNDWPQACGNRLDRSVPANKLVWLAWYLAELSKAGVEVEFTSPGVASKRPVKTWRIEGAPRGGVLAARGFMVSGQWVSPLAPGLSKGRWMSYIVQSLDVAHDRRLILLDTSVGDRLDVDIPIPFLGHSLAVGGAAWWARLGKAQREDIQRHVQLARDSGKSVVMAGHMPLSKFSFGDRRFLDRMGPSEYYSAHSHDPTRVISDTNERPRELNIASTTDWPMELVVRDFASPLADHEPALEIISLGVTSAADLDKVKGSVVKLRRHQTMAKICGQTYPKRLWKDSGFLRRHQSCAHQRAALDIERYLDTGRRLESDGPDAECEPSVSVAEDDIARVQRRLEEGGFTEAQRRHLLCSARAASHSETK